MKAVSLIIIVKNDPGVYETIKGLKNHQSEVKTEIVVVVRTHAGEKLKITDSKVKVINYRNSQKAITIPEQRNVGMKAAKYDPVVFIDASCVPLKGWLDALYEAYQQGEKIVAGYVQPAGNTAINNISGSLGNQKYLEECPTANLLVSKVVFKKVGGFDEHFEYGSDVDLMWRARDAGFKIRYQPKAVVTHEWGDLKAQFQRSFRYGRARLQLYLKHPHRWRYFLKKDGMLFIYPLFILFLPIGLFFPYYFLILIVPFVKNWRSNPLMQVALNLVFGWGVIVKAYELLRKRFS